MLACNAWIHQNHPWIYEDQCSYNQIFIQNKQSIEIHGIFFLVFSMFHRQFRSIHLKLNKGASLQMIHLLTKTTMYLIHEYWKTGMHMHLYFCIIIDKCSIRGFITNFKRTSDYSGETILSCSRKHLFNAHLTRLFRFV